MTDFAVLAMRAESRSLQVATRDLRSVELGAIGAERAVRNMERATRTASGGFTGLRSALNGISGNLFTLRNALVGLGAGLAFRNIVQTADAYTLLSSKIKTVSASSEEAAQRLKNVFEIAQRTRSDFETLGNTYQRLALSAGRLGLTQQSLGDLTETLAKTIKISGTTAGEAAGGMIQLTQAFSSGRLQGDELRTVFESLSGVVRAMEVYTGKTRGELRKMAADGILTGELVLKSIIAFKEQADKEFALFPKTVSDAFTTLHNAYMKATGEGNLATGATQRLAGAIGEVEKIVSSPAFSSGMNAMLKLIADMAAGTAGLIAKWEELLIRLSEFKSRLETLKNFNPLTWQNPFAAFDPRPTNEGRSFGASYGAMNYRLDELARRQYAEAQEAQRLREKAALESASYGNTLSSEYTSGAYFKGNKATQEELSTGKDELADEKQKLKSMELQNEVLRLQLTGNEELVRSKQLELEIHNAISDKLRKDAPDLAANMEQQIRLESELSKQLEDRKKLMDQIGEYVSAATDGMTAAFDRFLENGKLTLADFREFALQVFRDIARAAFQQAVIQPITKGLLSALTGAGGGSGIASDSLGGLAGTIYAKGGVINRGIDITAFARGGIVDSPTFFPMARGTGLMGEAGPEAVMPLRRGPGGRLGVEASGAGGDRISIVVNNNAGPNVHASAQGRRTSDGIQFEVIVEQLEGAMGQRIVDGRSKIGSAIASTHGLRRIGR